MALVRDLWLPSSLDTMTGPIWPSIEAENFELRPGLTALVLQNQFRGLPNEDPHEHISNVLEYANTVQYHGVSQDAIKCMLFTFSLRDAAKDWYYSLPSRSYTWGDISQAFLHRYFPLYKQAAIRDQILSFAQDGSESLYAAWERYKYLLRKCPNHGQKDWLVLQIFYRGLTHASRDLIDMSAGGTIMNKTVEGAIILIESIAFHQMQWGYERPSSNPKVASHLQSEAVCSISEQKSSMVPNIQNQHVPFRGQQHFRAELDPPCRKIDLTSSILDDDYDIFQDDATIVDQMETTVADPIPHGNETVQTESKLQEDVYEEPTLIGAKLRQQDMEKFTSVSQLCDWWNLVVAPIAHTCVTTVSGIFVKKKSLAPPVAASISVKESISEKNSEDEIPTPAHTIKQVGDIPRREIQEVESNLEELILQYPEKIPCVAELHDWWKSSVSLLKLSNDGDEENIAQKDSEVVISAPLPDHVSEYPQMGTLQTQLSVAGSSTIEDPEEERPQIEDVLEAKAQDDPEFEQPSNQVEDSSSTTLKEAKEAAVDELEEPEIHLPIVTQERDVAGSR
ncbi:uncharacterized protein [Triticum aestivum]|uniref:uncharacterized protein n=1 Tax=Triticum aestivum TaxID=4565 RepID=UPI001D00A887|nr:uncharacterized protein LOC123137113 [Triticum aestivum]